jgi:hypothetical protein
LIFDDNLQTSVRQLSAAQLNEIAQHLKIQQPSDWYRVTTQSFLANPITSQGARVNPRFNNKIMSS